MKLIDDHTEYFRAHLEGLAKTERRVYLSVIDLWQPSTTGEIAARARMDVRAVSALLGRLVERGAVLVEGSGRKRMYFAAERLYSIYYKLRRERDEATVVRNLVHFMAVFYTETELDEMSNKLKLEAKDSQIIHEGFRQAITEIPHIADFLPNVDQTRIGKSSESVATGKIEKILTSILAEGDEGRFDRVINIIDRLLGSRNADSIHLPDLLVATILHLRGVAYSELDDAKKAISSYAEVISRFGTNDTPEFQILVAGSLVNMGDEQERAGNLERAITTFDQVIERFGAHDTPYIQGQVVMAMISKGDIEERIGNIEDAISIYDRVVERYGSTDAPVVWEQLARALVNKMVAEVQRGRPEDAFAACDQVVERFGDCDVPEVQVQVARALVGKGIIGGLLGDHERAIAACDEVVERFGDCGVPELQIQLAKALIIKGEAAIQINRLEEALNICDTLEREFDTLADDDRVTFGWRAKWIRTRILLAQERHLAAMESFRSIYSALVLDNESMMAEMLGHMIVLVADGASERALVEILSSDGEKSALLAPLVVALRQRMGETIREPAEMVEVAMDILEEVRKRIAAKEDLATAARRGTTN